ncbi:germination lipoprotein GerS-related protein [Clostridium chauvoei]|uniref:Membrane associated protein n=2 Tax=Clostridium chauvoei TaxID=46867 RepID=A0ABD4RJ29_9CLOT|nr:germination lipoprotein GerS-related protein [Clostridium chauvoei]ATD54060.1 hypothetical protein BTM20_01930 [Clostridium chauvoei]ATD58488.1 hypothetical protein BTM21_12520 [Clostridium chauvoei]MBX7281309.1 hypothetical protein [Clostridium chauvoei]MBX7283785.1 hypothetical protein [Clostridium chauvoei]MBX7286398.1 hypothetical protein [Clostridium chauvoei]
MKKKILLTLLLCVPFISIILVIIFRLTAEPSNEEIIQKLRDTPYYTTRIEYTVKNTRGEESEETVLYYSKDKGARIDFGQDRVKIYKDGNVTVKDNISNKEYTMEEDMDKLHTIALMTNLLSFPMEEGSIEEGQEEWGDTQYIAFTSELFFENDHLDKIKVYVDKNEKVPLGAVIYDKDGKDRVRVIYKDFEKLKEMDDSIL